MWVEDGVRRPPPPQICGCGVLGAGGPGRALERADQTGEQRCCWRAGSPRARAMVAACLITSNRLVAGAIGSSPHLYRCRRRAGSHAGCPSRSRWISRDGMRRSALTQYLGGYSRCVVGYLRLWLRRWREGEAGGEALVHTLVRKLHRRRLTFQAPPRRHAGPLPQPRHQKPRRSKAARPRASAPARRGAARRAGRGTHSAQRRRQCASAAFCAVLYVRMIMAVSRLSSRMALVAM